MCSSVPARARPRRASPPEAWRDSFSADSASASRATYAAIGDVMLPEDRTVSFAEARPSPRRRRLRCADAGVQQRMMAAIDAAREAGDTLGGIFEVIATGVPVGLGSYVQWDRKLDGRLGQALMCIHAIKAVGIGIGPEAAVRRGSRVHDEILPAARRRRRRCGPPTTPVGSRAA